MQRLSSLRVLATLMLAGAFLSLSAGPGAAASPELEELRRVIEQQQQLIQQQQQTLGNLMLQVEELQKRTEQNAKAVSATEQQTEEIVRKVESAAAPPKTVESGQEKVSLSLSGQVNRAALYVADGENNELFHVDNDNSSTRFRLIARGQVTDDFAVGSQIEVQMESNSTASVNQESDNGVGGTSFTERKLEVYLDSATYGRVWLGQGDTASNSTSEVDLSGTSVVAYSAIGDMAGGMKFVNADTKAFGPAIGDVFSNFDGLSRDDRIRYDTPKFAGFQASTSHISGGGWDAALRYSADYGEIKTAAAIAYANNSSLSTTQDSRVNGSISVLHDNGLNATFAAGSAEITDPNRDDATFYYGKVGYIANIFDIGKTALSVDFVQTEDLAANGDEATSYGAFAVQHFSEYGTELYAGVRNHELDRTGSNFDDIMAAIAGARVKF